MVKPCSGIKTCKSIKVSKFNFQPGILFDAPGVSCVNESTNQFFNAPRNALNLENGDANRIHSRMRWYCIWLCQCWMTIATVLYANHDAREHMQSRLCYAHSQSFSQPTKVVRVSHANNFYRVYICIISTNDDNDDDNDDGNDVNKTKLLHPPSIPNRFDAF